MTEAEYKKRQARRRAGLCPVCGRPPHGGAVYCEECYPGTPRTRTLVSVNVPRDFVRRYCGSCKWATLNCDSQSGYCPFIDCPEHPQAYSKATGRPVPPEARGH